MLHPGNVYQIAQNYNLATPFFLTWTQTYSGVLIVQLPSLLGHNEQITTQRGEVLIYINPRCRPGIHYIRRSEALSPSSSCTQVSRCSSDFNTATIFLGRSIPAAPTLYASLISTGVCSLSVMALTSPRVSSFLDSSAGWISTLHLSVSISR